MDKIQEKILFNIAELASQGESVMCTMPRAAGKTTFIKNLLDGPLKEKDTCLACSHIDNGSYDSLINNSNLLVTSQKMLHKAIENKTFDTIIIEDIDSTLDFSESVLKYIRKQASQYIFIFTPFEYDHGGKTHPVKVLWDAAPWYKFQIAAKGCL